MATSISFVSESGDHYLSLFDDSEGIGDIICMLIEQYGEEFEYLYVKNCRSTELDTATLTKEVTSAITRAYIEVEDE